MSSSAKSTQELVTEIRRGVTLLIEGQRLQEDVIEELGGSVAAGFGRVSVLIVNQTQQTQEINQEISTLKNRQAVSGAFQAVSLIILVLWLMALATRAVYKCITKKVQADQEEMVEMLEASLARRKAKRRATGKQTGETNQ